MSSATPSGAASRASPILPADVTSICPRTITCPFASAESGRSPFTRLYAVRQGNASVLPGDSEETRVRDRVIEYPPSSDHQFRASRVRAGLAQLGRNATRSRNSCPGQRVGQAGGHQRAAVRFAADVVERDRDRVVGVAQDQSACRPADLDAAEDIARLRRDDQRSGSSP